MFYNFQYFGSISMVLFTLRGIYYKELRGYSSELMTKTI